MPRTPYPWRKTLGPFAVGAAVALPSIALAGVFKGQAVGEAFAIIGVVALLGGAAASRRNRVAYQRSLVEESGYRYPPLWQRAAFPALGLGPAIVASRMGAPRLLTLLCLALGILCAFDLSRRWRRPL